MQIYPMLVSLSKGRAKPEVEGLLKGHLAAAKDQGESEFTVKLDSALDLLSEAPSVTSFLEAAKSL